MAGQPSAVIVTTTDHVVATLRQSVVRLQASGQDTAQACALLTRMAATVSNLQGQPLHEVSVLAGCLVGQLDMVVENVQLVLHQWRPLRRR